MRQVDIERFEMIAKDLPGILQKTDEILIEIGSGNGSIYPVIKAQLLEIKRMVDKRIMPTEKEKENIRVGYIIDREYDGAEKLDEYAEIICKVDSLYAQLGEPPKFKYFSSVKDEAAFINTPCECCGDTEYCLDGGYFGREAKVKSVCVFCLAAGKQKVDVPEFIQNKLLQHLRGFYSDKSEREIKEIATVKISELERTPPVPWLVQNEWPVANGDFAKYEYTLGKYLFHKGKQSFFEAIEGIEKIRDKEMLWSEMGNKITVFGFSVIGAKKYTKIAIPQSLDPITVKKVWG
jgi:uncharacterized protein CbrC (UPF0167 family)